MTVAKPSLPLKTLQVLIDPTVVESLRSNLTAKTCPPIELLPMALDRCHASLQIDGPDYVGISPWLFPMVNLAQLLSNLTVLVLSRNLDGIQRSLTLLPFSSQIPSSARIFFNVVPPVLLRPNPQILHILPFLLLPSKTTIINTHLLLVQYLPTYNI